MTEISRRWLHRMILLWWEPTIVPSIITIAHTLLWALWILTNPDSAFRTPALVGVVTMSTKGLWFAICVAGPVVLLLGRPFLRVIGWVVTLFWWLFVGLVLLAVSPHSPLPLDCLLAGVCTFWLLCRHLQRRIVVPRVPL